MADGGPNRDEATMSSPSVEARTIGRLLDALLPSVVTTDDQAR